MPAVYTPSNSHFRIFAFRILYVPYISARRNYFDAIMSFDKRQNFTLLATFKIHFLIISAILQVLIGGSTVPKSKAKHAHIKMNDSQPQGWKT